MRSRINFDRKTACAPAKFITLLVRRKTCSERNADLAGTGARDVKPLREISPYFLLLLPAQNTSFSEFEQPEKYLGQNGNKQSF